MTSHILDVATWRTINEIHVNDGGTWRRIQEAYVNDGGVWRTVFIGDQITLSDRNVSDFQLSPGTAQAGYELRSTGDIFESLSGGVSADVGDWIVPKTNMANYECRATLVSGTVTGTMGTWLALTSNRTWSVGRSGSVGTTTGVFTIEIRRASDGVVMDSAQITLTAELGI